MSKPLMKSLLTYGLGNIMYSLVTLTLIPFYLEKLNVVDYGNLTLFLIASNIVTIFFSINISNGILRLFSDSEMKIDLKRVLFSILLLFFAVFIIILFTVSFFDDFFSYLIFKNSTYTDLVYLTIGYGFFRIFFQTILGTFRALEKVRLYVFLSILDVLLMAVINIYIVYSTEFNIRDVFKGYLIASSISFFFGVLLIRKYLLPSFDKKILKYLLFYGVPLSLANILSYLINYGNRFFLLHFVDTEKVAVFDVSQKISNVVGMLFVGAFLTSFTPFYLNSYNEDDFNVFEEKVNKVVINFTLVYFLFAIFTITSDDIFLQLLSKKNYLDSSLYVPILILSNFMYVIFMITTLGTNILKTTKVEMYITIAAIFVSLLLNYILILNIGLYGAALSQLLVNIITIVFMITYNKKYFPIKFDWKTILYVLVYFVTVSIIDSLMKYNNFILSFKIPVYLGMIGGYVILNKSFFYFILKKGLNFVKISNN